jgi:hypothetical protein
MFDMKNLSSLKKLVESAPDAMKAFRAVDQTGLASEALTAQQLIAVAVGLPSECHTHAARNAGAGGTQLSEAAQVAAAIRAGEAITHATHLFGG